MHLKAKIEEIIEITDSKTGEKSFLYCEDNKWIHINQNEYNKILEGEKNDNI